ncbi:hypothetical protein LguiA_011034 [Lonicera macranthoides]
MPHHHATSLPPSPRPRHSPRKPNPRFLSFLLKSLIMSLILSLFLLFLGFASILLLHLLLAGTTSLHRRRRRPLSTTPTNGYSSDQLQIHLPKLQFHPESAIADCAVCLDNFNDGDFFRRLPACNHIFHVKCVDSWLIKKPNCPLCRSPVQLDSGSSRSAIRGDDDYKLLWAAGV